MKHRPERSAFAAGRLSGTFGFRIGRAAVTAVGAAKRSGALLACLCLVAVAAAAQAEAPEREAAQAPALAARTLSGRALRIPADLAGSRPALLVVGYSRASAARTTACSRQVMGDGALRDRVEVYPVAVLERVPRPFRRMVVSGIRRDVPESRHDRFLVVASAEAAWKRETGYADPDAAYLLLVDGARIVWRGRGDCDGAAVAALRAAVAGDPGAVP